MRTSLFISITVIIFTSCSRYQYVTISGSDIKKNDKQEFVVENDSIRIQYNFNGHNAPINLTIQNKLNVPVYIDWQQSALIINDKAISYMPNTVPIEGAFNGATVNWNSYRPNSSYSTTSGTINAKAILPDKLDFIPPQSYIAKNPMGITNQLIENIPDSAVQQVKLTLAGGSYARATHAAFTETSSPLRFKSYLTLIIGEQTARPVAYQHSFYISEVYTTELDPGSFWFNSEYRGNQYYVTETTGFGKGFAIVAGVALLTTAAALEQSTADKPKQ